MGPGGCGTSRHQWDRAHRPAAPSTFLPSPPTSPLAPTNSRDAETQNKGIAGTVSQRDKTGAFVPILPHPKGVRPPLRSFPELPCPETAGGGELGPALHRGWGSGRTPQPGCSPARCHTKKPRRVGEDPCLCLGTNAAGREARPSRAQEPRISPPPALRPACFVSQPPRSHPPLSCPFTDPRHRPRYPLPTGGTQGDTGTLPRAGGGGEGWAPSLPTPILATDAPAPPRRRGGKDEYFDHLLLLIPSPRTRQQHRQGLKGSVGNSPAQNQLRSRHP